MTNEEIERLVAEKTSYATMGDESFHHAALMLLAEIARRLPESTPEIKQKPINVNGQEEWVQAEKVVSWRVVCPYCAEVESILAIPEPPQKFRNECRQCGKGYLCEWKK